MGRISLGIVVAVFTFFIQIDTCKVRVVYIRSVFVYLNSLVPPSEQAYFVRMFLTIHLILYISVIFYSSLIVVCTNEVSTMLLKRTSHTNHDDDTISSAFINPQFDTSYHRHNVARKGMDEAQKEGRNIKAASSIGVLADKNAKEDLPQVYFRSGRKGGKVVSIEHKTV